MFHTVLPYKRFESIRTSEEIRNMMSCFFLMYERKFYFHDQHYYYYYYVIIINNSYTYTVNETFVQSRDNRISRCVIGKLSTPLIRTPWPIERSSGRWFTVPPLILDWKSYRQNDFFLFPTRLTLTEPSRRKAHAGYTTKGSWGLYRD